MPQIFQNEKNRGCAFEVFAEAYIICGYVDSVEVVYPENVVPTKIKKSLFNISDHIPYTLSPTS